MPVKKELAEVPFLLVPGVELLKLFILIVMKEVMMR